VVSNGPGRINQAFSVRSSTWPKSQLRADWAYYVSEDIFEREQDVVFPKLWFFVGMQSQIPQAGDYFVRQIGRESVIIVRDGDGAVRAFFNV
jgi:phenylpropionate dioxygenase-like ring-hydroxylating dioxygenase large terminal subunit